MKKYNRFIIPGEFADFIEMAINLKVIDHKDLMALMLNNQDSWTITMTQIVDYAFLNKQHSIAHSVLSPMFDNIMKAETQEETDDVTDFDARFALFFDGCKQIYNKYMDTVFPGMEKDKFSYKNNRKYIRVMRGGSVHCFVDKTNGNVLKAASWSAPAKHARGNIFDANNGLGSMGEYGPAYLR